MNAALTIEQRFALTRARYEVSRMSRPALEKTALRLLKTRMEQKNGVQNALMQNGIMFKIDEELDDERINNRATICSNEGEIRSRKDEPPRIGESCLTLA